MKLERVLTNLISNAIKFTSTGEVRTEVDELADGSVQIRVRDTGPGVPPEHLLRIFDEFFQLRSPDRDISKGAGLGLAISRRLVDAMGGQIAVESALDQGSTFIVTLPGSVVVPGPATEPAISDCAADDGERLQGLRILLVEDHAGTRRAASRLLSGEGAVVTEAADGVSALRLAHESSPQVLLLDMMLPDMDGREVLKAIQANRPATLQRILVLTGDMTEERNREIQRLGADVLVPKPVDIERLLTILHNGSGKVEQNVLEGRPA